MEEKATKVYTDYHLESCIKKEAFFEIRNQISKSAAKSDLTQLNDQIQERLNQL